MIIKQQTQRDEDITEEACLQLIQDFEPNDLSRHNEQMTISGFSLFLHSKYCDIFNWKHDQVIVKVFNAFNQTKWFFKECFVYN